MTKPSTPEAPAGPPAVSGSWAAGLRRLVRLSRKELREILRDRRTILTLILMPALIYPLLSIAFRQFYLANMGAAPETMTYRLAFQNDAEARFILDYLDLHAHLARPGQPERPSPTIEVFGSDNMEQAIGTGSVDVGIRLKNVPTEIRADHILMFDGEFIYREDSTSGKDGLAFLEKRLREANTAFLTARLRHLRVPQRPEPGKMLRVPLQSASEGTPFSLAALVPLILILTTVTGAVYPAIDLTAGERERGTLDVLMAAPIPRLSLLFAKYIAVLTVALLTALVNLFAMTITVVVSGLGPTLFGASGLSLTVIIQVLGLLVLFASFFSAMLLAISSFARSFKEAQAYLVPLMLLALGPGLIGMMPGLKLSGLLLVAPLLNIVLLARDLFEGTATIAAAGVVIIATGLYALAALGLAARVFGAEAVLFGTQSGWSDLFRRPPLAPPFKGGEATALAPPLQGEEPASFSLPLQGGAGGAGRWAPTLTSALACLAVMFPAYFVASGLLAQSTQVEPAIRLSLIMLTTAAIFAGIPWAAAVWARVPLNSGLRLRWPPWLAWPATILLGLSLWPFAHELVVVARAIGLRTLSDEQLARARELVEQWRALPPWLLLAALAIVPAVSEELFFRGYLFSALRTRLRPAATIFGSALLFGLFHYVTVDGLTIERLLPSTLMGVVLGWVCWRTGSVLPGMVLHAVHNGLLVTLALYHKDLGSLGLEDSEQSHLPVLWLACAAGGTVLGVFLMWVGTRRGAQDSIR